MSSEYHDTDTGPDDSLNNDAHDGYASSALEPQTELETSYLHPSSLLFTLIAQIRQNIIPAVFAIFGAANGNGVIIVLAIVGFLLTLGFAIARYLTLRYSIRDGELTVQSGLIFRRLRKVPTNRIQNIDLVQNVFHRFLKVAEVRVETASGTEPEAILRVLSLAQVEQLREKVRTSSNLTSESAVSETPAHPTESTDVEGSATGQSATEVLKIPLSWLIKAGLASNRGMVLVGFLAGLWLQSNSEEGAWRQLSELFSEFSDHHTLVFWLGSIAAVLTGLMAVRLLGVGWFILRFFGYRLVRENDDFKISCGLFTKVSATVPVRKIQFVSIHRTLFMRWLGMASIRIETAGGAAKRREDATTTVSKRWFIPVVPEPEVTAMMNQIRENFPWEESDISWQMLRQGAATRKLRAGIVFSLALIAIGLAVLWPWGWILGLILMPLIVLFQLRSCKCTMYARLPEGIVFRSGVFTQKTSVTFFDKIQSVRFDQSPFDRRWQMASLAVDTAAAGPANHRISIRYLDAQFAQSEYRAITDASSNR